MGWPVDGADGEETLPRAPYYATRQLMGPVSVYPAYGRIWERSLLRKVTKDNAPTVRWIQVVDDLRIKIPSESSDFWKW